MRGKGLDAARALGALVLTLALVVGVPALLIAIVGNPLPESVPTIDEIRILLTQNGQGFADFISSSLAVLIWIIWAQLVLALIVEVVAVGRQSETRRLPTLPGIQGFAARLIAAMTLATALAAAPLMAPAVGALNLPDLSPTTTSVSAPAPVATIKSTANVQTQVMPAPAAERAVEAANSDSALVVSEHTELWDLADSAYGDGVNWKLIAHANAGFTDAEGALITDDTESVAPGTELRMPGTVDVNSLARHGTVSSSAVHVVEAGDSMWTVAEQAVEDDLDRQATNAEVADYWADVVDANASVPSGDVDLIYPGDELILPGAAGVEERPVPEEVLAEEDSSAAEEVLAEESPVPEEALAEEDSSAAEAVAAEVAGTEAVEGRSVESTDSSAAVDSDVADGPSDNRNALGPAAVSLAGSSASDAFAPSAEAPGAAREVEQPVVQRSVVAAVGLASLGAAMLSAGVVGALRRRRDLQRRTRPQASIARQASPEAEAFEAALRQSSHQVRESQLGLGWRMVPAATLQAGRQLGPLYVHCDEAGRLRAIAIGRAETAAAAINESEPAAAINESEPTEPFDSEMTQIDVWRSDASPGSAVADSDSSGGVSAASTIVLDPVDVELGIAALSTTLLIGTDTETGEAVFFDLASTGSLSINGDSDATKRFVRTAVLDLAVSERADDLCLIAVDTATELEPLERVHAANSFADALAHAVRSGHAAADSTTPVVVIAAVEPDEDDPSVAALRDCNAVIVAPNIESDAQIVIDERSATLLPSGTVVELATYADDEYLAVAELVETTSQKAMEPADQSAAVEDIVDVVPLARCPIDAGPIEVKVLGPVEVAGASAFSSLKAVDIVTFLAFHRNGVDGDQIKSWVWPAYSPPTDKAFANVMSRARTGLGAGEDGEPFLSRAGSDRTYRLSVAVTTDFDRFRAIVDLADAADDRSDTVTILKQALELIRGVPFTGGGASSFAWADNHVRANVEFMIDEAVHRCADLALEVGDLETARWAALKGLELVPGCEQCFRRRFLVAGAGSNLNELRRAMADLESVAAAELGEPEAIDLISGDLLELYHEVDQALMAGPS